MKLQCLFGGFLCLAAIIDVVTPLCVLESDFGFKINCAFKKSGLFRVRNLGGIKAHASLGFSLGDELGFDQSLTNQDPSRRRSVSLKNGAPNILVDTTNRPAKQEKRGKQNRIMMRPVPQQGRPNQAAMNKLSTLHKRLTTTMQPIIVSGQIDPNRAQPTITMAKPMAMGVPAFKPLPPKEETLKVLPIATRKTFTPLDIPQGMTYENPVSHQVQDLAYNTKKVDDYNTISGYSDDTTLKLNKEDINSKIAEIAKAGNISMEAVEAAIALRQQQLLNKYANIQIPTTTTTKEPPVVFELEPEPEIIVAPPPQKPKRNPTLGKVMNAPREYYPVGYEKNFDDHFQSKVDLPDTNFHCGDQKYFPGLYGDENLGCMVFHVCALTDDGLVMKSFLCPESTLFDQTILKCNWWFYVDCKNTASLYDTNIPVSKSYQLMKALTFFSSYKKEIEDGHPTNPEEIGGIKDAISILENHDSKTSDTEKVEIITPSPTPLIDERHNKREEITPVYRGNRKLNNTRDSNEFRLITVGAGINFNSTKKPERRRLANRFNRNSTTVSPSTETTTVEEKPTIEKEDNPSVEKEEKLTDQIEPDTLLKEAETAAPVRRFYRSSAEKEIAIINNEKVQIVRPTQIRSTSILDEAVLGKSYARFKREVLRIPHSR
ncbi:uncharacterized protein LOC123713931 isoform X2 [Pieris brassicae]|uniref:Chitin-binding type-2 domain-containing protein n=1 Tax=Pieris brassicae TaxID=7116 RepID=A0A9P0XHA4_PIEBR|nr:uncharacterized protein LOC123713931 isoform X2 [Pieris brassicae]CAH4034812.1 unnamed protein product [Pieris brassicae]